MYHTPEGRCMRSQVCTKLAGTPTAISGCSVVWDVEGSVDLCLGLRQVLLTYSGLKAAAQQ